MGHLLRFGVFELNLVTEELRKFGTPIKIAPQPVRAIKLICAFTLSEILDSGSMESGFMATKSRRPKG
jgi:hypothetical protein